MNISAEAITKKQKPQKITGWAQFMIDSPLSIRDWPMTSFKKVTVRSPR